MVALAPILLLCLALATLGVLELVLHRRNLRRIPIRIHVNGTRGKSSVTRLLYGAIRESGVVVCAKTTGTLARMILPDGRELPIYRPSGANVIEQRRIVATAAAYGAQALVIECMAVQPQLQALCELKLISATHGVITNARPDHLEEMGPDALAVAHALAGITPIRGHLFTAEREHVAPLRVAAADRGSRFELVSEADVDSVTAAELAGFSHQEHAENVALALAVARSLGIDRSTALRGMQNAPPDPGALTIHELYFFGRHLLFFNGFAANDPVSTQRLWDTAVASYPALDTKIAIFNCRSDRPDRSIQLARDFVHWAAMDHVVLMGTGTDVFARAAVDAGFDAGRLVLVEQARVEFIFERILSLATSETLIMGMGNIGGNGLDLVRYFANRAWLGPLPSGPSAPLPPASVPLFLNRAPASSRANVEQTP